MIEQLRLACLAFLLEYNSLCWTLSLANLKTVFPVQQCQSYERQNLSSPYINSTLPENKACIFGDTVKPISGKKKNGPTVSKGHSVGH